jgi:hypothetical protein
MMLSLTILLTKASSPPGVIISTSAPVQICKDSLKSLKNDNKRKERTALGNTDFVSDDWVICSLLE